MGTAASSAIVGSSPEGRCRGSVVIAASLLPLVWMERRASSSPCTTLTVAVFPSRWNSTRFGPGGSSVPPRYTLDAIFSVSSCPNSSATPMATAPAAVSARGTRVLVNAAAAIHSSTTPSAMSSAPPTVSTPFSPRSGNPTCTAQNTPAIAPTVFAAYTAPMLASPWPRFIRWNVMSGSVVPAQNVAGSMIATAIASLNRVNNA